MTPIEFIKDRLGKLAMLFPRITIKYAYDEEIETHVVELTPVSEYYHNKLLDDHWIPISMQFQQDFPREDITFISSDSPLKIENPEFEWNGEVNLLNIDQYNDMIVPLRTEAIGVEFSDEVSIQKLITAQVAHDIQIFSNRWRATGSYHFTTTMITSKFQCDVTVGYCEPVAPLDDHDNDEFPLAA